MPVYACSEDCMPSQPTATPGAVADVTYTTEDPYLFIKLQKGKYLNYC